MCTKRGRVFAPPLGRTLGFMSSGTNFRKSGAVGRKREQSKKLRKSFAASPGRNGWMPAGRRRITRYSQRDFSNRPQAQPRAHCRRSGTMRERAEAERGISPAEDRRADVLSPSLEDSGLASGASAPPLSAAPCAARRVPEPRRSIRHWASRPLLPTALFEMRPPQRQWPRKAWHPGPSPCGPTRPPTSLLPGRSARETRRSRG